jgi:hypothetical protein
MALERLVQFVDLPNISMLDLRNLACAVILVFLEFACIAVHETSLPSLSLRDCFIPQRVFGDIFVQRFAFLLSLDCVKCLVFSVLNRRISGTLGAGRRRVVNVIAIVLKRS